MESTPKWRIITAFFIDLLISFFILGYIIALLTGNITDGGFSVDGLPGLATFILVIVYFRVMKKFFGRTLGDMLLKVN